MRVFSCRAECEHDVKQLRIRLTRLRNAGEVDSAALWLKDHEYPDRAVEIHTNKNLHFLRYLLRQIPDSHVMIQSLREGPLSTNSLDRDHDVE
jgi:hypothetical protein